MVDPITDVGVVDKIIYQSKKVLKWVEKWSQCMVILVVG